MEDEYRRLKLYKEVARKDRYAEFYSLLDGKISKNSISQFCKINNFDKKEKEIFYRYMKKEKISYIACQLNMSDRYVDLIIEKIYYKTKR